MYLDLNFKNSSYQSARQDKGAIFRDSFWNTILETGREAHKTWSSAGGSGEQSRSAGSCASTPSPRGTVRSLSALYFPSAAPSDEDSGVPPKFMYRFEDVIVYLETHK